MYNRPVVMTVPERLRKALALVRELQRVIPPVTHNDGSNVRRQAHLQEDLDRLDDHLTDRLAKEQRTWSPDNG